MTTTTPHGQVPDALRLAEEITNLECSSEAVAKTIAAAADELCRLHVENASLRASPAASPTPPVEQPDLTTLIERGAKAWAGVDAQQPAPSAAGRVKLPEPDTAETAPWTGWKVKYHSPDQIIGYGNQQFNAGRQFEVERLAALWAPQPSSAPQTDSQPAVQQWNDLIGKETHADADGLLVWRDEVDFAIPTPPAEQQAAPKAAPGVGNSGFDHQTAADFLSGKTVSDEAVRNFVAASRWAHDERAALSATLLAMHGVLTSREAEIALLKKALLEAETAPQPAPAPLSDDVVKDAARYRWLRATTNYVTSNGERIDVRNMPETWDVAIDTALAAQGGK